MRAETISLLLAASVGVVSAADLPRPRGVGPEFAKFYKAADSFTCISNPSIHLLPSQINDEFCDCPDGSDEPGTSACSYLSPLSPQTPSSLVVQAENISLALPGFYCKNKGHNPAYIPFTYVNDGICDYELCCDGSDEWEGVGGTKCQDKCSEIGKEWKKLNEKRRLAMSSAAKRRKELVTEASRLRLEIEDRIKDLEPRIEASELKVQAMEKEKEEIEYKEKNRVVKKPAAAGKVGILAGLARERIKALRDGISKIRHQRDMFKERLAEVESILAQFKEEYNPNFNDEGVKRAVRSWEEYAVREKQLGDSGDEEHFNDLQKEEDGIEWDEFENASASPPDDDIAVLYRFEEYLPKPIRDWLDQKLRDLRTMLEQNGILAPKDDEPSASTSDNKAVREAQERLDTTRKSLEDQTRDKANLEEDLAKDYGPEDIFRALKGKCISLDSGEYTYELCWMDRVTQKSKKGGSQNSMGEFAGMGTIQVDEEVSADGKGLGSGERITMKHENGQGCWNGPNRSVLVVLACAPTEEIWKVVEEEKCVYRMEVGSPAVCTASNEGGGGGSGSVTGTGRDEL